ncbi:DUF3310 domain-containing protein [Gorillibacterium sp. sgz500922]|uniref:DUF3310 domain-containing protein n=1 Tax=Gorillibacterium sp. sgz500922 TaxID=3446694 RepID=UPI003F674968
MGKEKDGPGKGLTKKAMLEAIASGETISSTEKAYGLKYNSLYYWIKRWDLQGVNPGKARWMLDQMNDEQEETVEAEPVDSEEEAPQTPADEVIARQNAEIALLRGRVSEVTALYENAMRRYGEALAELERKYTGTEGALVDLREELEEEKAASAKVLDMLNETKLRLNVAGDKLAALEAERAMLLQTIEQAATQEEHTASDPNNTYAALVELGRLPLTGARPASDPVNHPGHYTAGKVECIDAIEAATTGLQGAEAYSTGQIIKYTWRWKWKNGVEDLRKARWYLDRLIGEVEAE